METLLQSRSLVQRAFWLIRLRWVAIAGLAGATFFASEFLKVTLPTTQLFILSGILLGYNFVLYDLVKYFTWGRRRPKHNTVSRIITFQISMDLLILTVILHYSGGIENPFFLYFVFHMVLTSIMLSKAQSYIQATLAVLFFGGCVAGEYTGIIKHYELVGFAAHNLYQNGLFVFGTFFIFTTTLYLVVYMTTSVTGQLRKQQDDFERANYELQQKDNLKNEYVLRVTHDIKGHLAAIESCLDVILNDLAGPVETKQRDLIERAHRRASRCMAFIKALLRLTRMKLTGELDMENFSIRNTIFNTLTSIERRAAAKNLRVTHSIDEGVDQICGEPVLLEEAIVNILYNAARYTPDKGRIHISATDEGKTILIQISDSGIGIPPGDEKKIFEEFHRAENARQIEHDGTGLGLSIAKQVVDRHHGEISAKNNEDAGSTFSIRLPKQPE